MTYLIRHNHADARERLVCPGCCFQRDMLKRINEGGPLPRFASGGLLPRPPTDEEIYAEVDAARTDAEKRDAWRRSVGLLPPRPAS